jgi:hypothetical protein
LLLGHGGWVVDVRSVVYWVEEGGF